MCAFVGANVIAVYGWDNDRMRIWIYVYKHVLIWYDFQPNAKPIHGKFLCQKDRKQKIYERNL